MKRTSMIVISGAVMCLALTGCPPADEGTATPGTATTTGEVGGGTATSAAPATAAESGKGTPTAGTPDAEMLKTCLAVTDKMVACTSDFLPVVVATRIKLDFPAGMAEKGKDEAGKKALLAAAAEEWKTDSVDPKKTEMCTMLATEMAAEMKADKAAVDACMTKADCKEFAACWAPLEEKHMGVMKTKMAAKAAAGGTAPAAK